MKIGGIDMPIVDENFGSKLEFETALSLEDWNTRMNALGVSIPQSVMITIYEIMCSAAYKTVMGVYNRESDGL